MSEQWPSEPGRVPPVASPGAPPVAGGWPPAPPAPPTTPTPTPTATSAPQTPAASSWPRGGDVWSTPPPPPPPPPPSPWRGRQGLVFAAVVVAVALLAAGVTWLALRAGTGEGEVAAEAPATTTTTATTTPPPSTPGPSTPPTTTAPVDPAAVAAEVRELQAFVEAERGLEFRQDVTVEVLDDAAFEERLLAEVDAEAEDIELQQRLLSALGLIEPGTDLLAAQRQLLGEGVLGWYDPETDELVVRGAALTPFTRQTIVHELVHALDDQWFELDRPEYEDRTDEVATGLTAVLEGDATRVEDAWVATLSPEEADQRLAEEARYALEADVSGVPSILLDLLLFPYEDGRAFVDELVATAGPDALDAAIVDPPTTTEQILLPGAFFAGEGAVAVEVPDAAGEVIDQGTFGMLMLQLLLEQAVRPSEAYAGAEGWAGDAYVAWETPDEATCVRVEVTVDTPTDVLELLQGLEQYVFDRPDVEVSQIGPLEVAVEGCTQSAVTGGGGDRS